MIKGIDVSRWQGAVDWAKVAADGVQFAMIKVLQGARNIDANFHANMRGAIANAIPVGVYVYSKAKDAAGAEAEALVAIELCKPYNLDYPIAIDFESSHFLPKTKAQCGAIIDAFCSTIESNGYMPLLYSNKDWLTTHIPDTCYKRWDVWLAQWRSTPPDWEGEYTIWQRGNGTVDGVSGKCDLNWGYKDYAALYEATTAAKPIQFTVTSPISRGDDYRAMQEALNLSGYTDADGDSLSEDGKWGKRSQQAFDRLIAAHTAPEAIATHTITLTCDDNIIYSGTIPQEANT